MQNISEKYITIVFLTLELLAVGHRAPNTGFKSSLTEKVPAVSVDLCKLERWGYLAYTEVPFESAPYFKITIGSELDGFEELENGKC